MTIILPHVVSGPHQAATIVFLHGWPESGAMWDPVVNAMKHKYRCVTMTMPHYGGRAEAQERGYAAWGYRFDEVADMIAATIKSVTNEKVALVGFDMGSLWAQNVLERHSHLVSRVCLVDVGVLATGRSTLVDVRDLVRLGFMYQYFQIIMFLLAKIPGLSAIADRLLLAVLRATSTEAQSEFKTASADIGYAYFQRHWQIVLEFLRLRGPLLTKPTDKFPAQPTLFMYGTEKSISFFSDDWFRAIDSRRDGSETVSFPSSHWIMVTHLRGFVGKLDEWLDATKRLA